MGGWATGEGTAASDSDASGDSVDGLDVCGNWSLLCVVLCGGEAKKPWGRTVESSEVDNREVLMGGGEPRVNSLSM